MGMGGEEQRESGEEGGERISRDCAEQGTQLGAGSQEPEIITQAEIKSRTPNQLGQPGALGFIFFLSLILYSTSLLFF